MSYTDTQATPQRPHTGDTGDTIQQDPQQALNAAKHLVETLEAETIFAKFDPKAATDERLTPTQFRIYAIYCTNRNNKNNNCYHQLTTIANQAGCTKKTVIEAKKKLIKYGYIQAKPRYKTIEGQTRRTSDLITFPTLEIKPAPKRAPQPVQPVSKPTQTPTNQYKTKQKTVQTKQKTHKNLTKPWQNQENRPPIPEWQGLQPIKKPDKQTVNNILQQTRNKLNKTLNPIPI